jgi:hypothetical protein
MLSMASLVRFELEHYLISISGFSKLSTVNQLTNHCELDGTVRTEKQIVDSDLCQSLGRTEKSNLDSRINDDWCRSFKFRIQEDKNQIIKNELQPSLIDIIKFEIRESMLSSYHCEKDPVIVTKKPTAIADQEDRIAQNNSRSILSVDNSNLESIDAIQLECDDTRTHVNKGDTSSVQNRASFQIDEEKKGTIERSMNTIYCKRLPCISPRRTIFPSVYMAHGTKVCSPLSEREISKCEQVHVAASSDGTSKVLRSSESQSSLDQNIRRKDNYHSTSPRCHIAGQVPKSALSTPLFSCISPKQIIEDEDENKKRCLTRKYDSSENYSASRRQSKSKQGSALIPSTVERWTKTSPGKAIESELSDNRIIASCNERDHSFLRFNFVQSPAMAKKINDSPTSDPAFPILPDILEENAKTSSSHVKGADAYGWRKPAVVPSSSRTTATGKVSPGTPRIIFPHSPHRRYYSPSQSTIDFRQESLGTPCGDKVLRAGSNIPPRSILRKTGRYTRKLTPDEMTKRIDVGRLEETSTSSPATCLVLNSTPFETQIKSMKSDGAGTEVSSVEEDLWKCPPRLLHERAVSEPLRRSTFFDPHVWVREFDRTQEEKEQTWYTGQDILRFKTEAISRIARYHKMMRFKPNSCSILPTGNAARPAVMIQKQQRALFSHEALRVDTENIPIMDQNRSEG